MRLMVLRNPELNNTVCSYQVDHPLLKTLHPKNHIGSIYRSKRDGLVHYLPTTDIQVRRTVENGWTNWEDYDNNYIKEATDFFNSLVELSNKAKE